MVIYKAVNKINGKIYIGKTTRSLEIRLSEHKHEKRMPFSRAYQKYGEQNFNILIIDYANTEQALNETERKWIAYYNSKKPNGYNITDGGDGASGVKREDTAKRNMSLVGEKNHMFGKKCTDEEKKKFGQPGEKNARYGVKLKDDFKQLISDKTKAAMRRPEVRHKFIEGIKNRKSLKGIKRSKESIEKSRVGLKLYWEKRKAGVV